MKKNIRQRTKTHVPGIWQTTDNSYVVIARWSCPATGRRFKKEATASTIEEAIAAQQRLRQALMTTQSETIPHAPRPTTPVRPTEAPTPTQPSTPGETWSVRELEAFSAQTTSTWAPTPPTRAAQAEGRLGQGTTAPRFGDFAEQWLALQVKRIAPSTTERYTAELAHWVTRLGELRLDEVTPPLVRAAIAEMLDDAAHATVNGRLRLLKAVLQQAVDDGQLTRNAATAVRSLPVGRTRGPRGTALSPREFARYLEATHAMIEDGTLKPDVGRMVLVLAWTGLRLGEIRALRFDDWDHDEQELRVDRSGWRNHVKGTKSGEPRRAAVVEPLRVALEDQRVWLQVTRHPGAGSGLIFPCDPDMRARAHVARSKRDPSGNARLTLEGSWLKAAATLRDAVRKVVARAGTPELSPHGFRRTAENLARRAGVDGLVRRAHAGWRSERVQAMYATVDPDERRAAGAAVVALVASVKQGHAAPVSPPAASPASVTPTARDAAPDTPGTPVAETAAPARQSPIVVEECRSDPAVEPPAAGAIAGAFEVERLARQVRPARPSGTPDVPDDTVWN